MYSKATRNLIAFIISAVSGTFSKGQVCLESLSRLREPVRSGYQPFASSQAFVDKQSDSGPTGNRCLRYNEVQSSIHCFVFAFLISKEIASSHGAPSVQKLIEFSPAFAQQTNLGAVLEKGLSGLIGKSVLLITKLIQV